MNTVNDDLADLAALGDAGFVVAFVTDNNDLYTHTYASYEEAKRFVDDEIPDYKAIIIGAVAAEVDHELKIATEDRT